MSCIFGENAGFRVWVLVVVQPVDERQQAGRPWFWRLYIWGAVRLSGPSSTRNWGLYILRHSAWTGRKQRLHCVSRADRGFFLSCCYCHLCGAGRALRIRVRAIAQRTISVGTWRFRVLRVRGMVTSRLFVRLQRADIGLVRSRVASYSGDQPGWEPKDDLIKFCSGSLVQPSGKRVKALLISVHYGALQPTLELLRSLSQMKRVSELHVLIVDNKSADGSSMTLRDAVSGLANVELFELTANAGYFEAARFALDHYH